MTKLHCEYIGGPGDPKLLVRDIKETRSNTSRFACSGVVKWEILEKAEILAEMEENVMLHICPFVDLSGEGPILSGALRVLTCRTQFGGTLRLPFVPADAHGHMISIHLEALVLGTDTQEIRRSRRTIEKGGYVWAGETICLFVTHHLPRTLEACDFAAILEACNNTGGPRYARETEFS